MGQQGLWYDGSVALERPVEVCPGPDGLVLVDESGAEHRVARNDLVRMAAPRGRLKLGHRKVDGWRLSLEGQVSPELLNLIPRRAGSLGPGISRRTMGFLIGVSGAATILAGVIIFAPEHLAAHMPLSVERKLGAAYDLPIGAMRCTDAGAQSALNAIVDRLDPEARRDGFTIELLDLDQANAAALPGGRMVVFKGLVEQVGDADALAGIIAHEIAHVRRRHVASAVVRELGLGAVITLVGGGAVASNAGGLVSLTFSRSAEAEADAEAISMLRRAGIDPRPTAKAFEGFRRMEGDWPEWLGSHPASAGRAQNFLQSHDKRASYRPALEPGQEKPLLDACQD